MEKSWKDLGFWSEKYNGKFQLEPEPFEGEPITARSTFMYSASASPMTPCCASYSGWYHMPNPFDLASYIRFMLLPVYIAWALNIDEELDSDGRMARVEDLLEKADIQDDEFSEETMKAAREVIRLLDMAMEAEGDVKAFRLIRKAQDIFNTNLGRAGGWTFEVKVYDNPLEVVDHLYESYDPDEWVEDDDSDNDSDYGMEDESEYEKRQKEAVRAICRQALTDREKGKILLTLIRRTHMGMD